MAGLKDLLLEKGPQIAMGFLAAKQGGPQATSAFMQGLQEAQARQQATARMGAADERQAMLDARGDELHQAQLANLQADNTRQDQNLEQQKFARALQLIQQATMQQAETATDPAAADAAIQAQAGAASEAFGVPAERLTPFVQSVAPLISARKKKQAQDLYARAEKRYNPKGDHPEWETSITLQTGEQFGDITPAKLREMFEAPAVDAMGAPAQLPTLDPEATAVGSFDAHFADVLAAEEAKRGAPLGRAEKAALRLQAKKSYDAANDRPADSGASDMRRFNMEQRLVTQWDKANAPLKEMRRQLTLMDTGLKRFRAGDTNGGSQAVLVTFQKILDPTSVVRESEYARTAAGQSLLNRIDGYISKLEKGGSGLTEAELASMVQTAREMLDGMASFNAGLRRRIDSTATEYRLDPRMIFDDVGVAPAVEAPAPAAGGNPNQAIEDALRQNGITGKVVSVRPKAR